MRGLDNTRDRISPVANTRDEPEIYIIFPCTIPLRSLLSPLLLLPVRGSALPGVFPASSALRAHPPTHRLSLLIPVTANTRDRISGTANTRDVTRVTGINKCLPVTKILWDRVSQGGPALTYFLEPF